MNPRTLRIEDYNYPLPASRIATHPLAERDACRLLCYDSQSRRCADRCFRELPGLLPPGALLVYNNTRVINARLKFRKTSGATIEIFCLEPAAPADYERNFAARAECGWVCLVGNSKRWKEGDLTMDLTVDGAPVTLTASRTSPAGTDITFRWTGDVPFSDIIAAAGEIPIPPYLNRASEASDATDYQTVYSHIEGSVAAPTAGLHFTPALLAALDARGIRRREVTLHVGAGTFRPVKADTIGEHDMHSEFITVPREVIADLAATESPIVAVGTTSVRTLESLYHIGRLIIEGRWTDGGELPQWAPYEESGEEISTRQALAAILGWLDGRGQTILGAYTRIIIAPGYRFRVVDAMITNFHQPQSTLLLLVSAFLDGQWRIPYDHALGGDYRFLSYGDACLLSRTPFSPRS